ncbi:helix-turn-helix domain-containing protein [Pseudarthrobacter sp. NamE2]|uniref:helix-turn-helix domain-containing protein n=1 Tax=Pseudarthrobacter sp. NamE2 TaxID=2576838 RepID=UPI0010FE2C23|nr:helix-turn-helix domain-containing protein [Pseudarthrobacter sp. NamE2]TLM83651.1 helix-turn-helix domain-containing protein [Pseudarthrobacter sp. NamE2]
MAKRTEEVSRNSAPVAGPFPKMLTLEQVEEVLNLGKPLVYALVRSGELRAAQFGGRGVWRVREDDLAAYIEAAYEKTAERIASGQVAEGEAPEDD